MVKEALTALLTNKLLWVGVISNVVAQVLKIFTHIVTYKEFKIRRLFQTGGMPSSHTATFVGLATAVAIQESMGSTYFAIAALLAFLVIYDSCGIRREAGKHADALNDILAQNHMQNNNQETPPDPFKTLLGHTVPQVIVGAFVGICVALLMLYVFWT